MKLDIALAIRRDSVYARRVVTVAALRVYPLKSARGVSVEEARVEARGLAGDRRWMVVGEDRQFVSQRSAPELARVAAALTPGGLTLTAEGREPVAVEIPGASDRRIEVGVWGDAVEAAPADPRASAWIADVLGRPSTLVYLPEDSVRPVDPGFARPGDHVSFADGYPLLLTSESSLADLNARLEAPVPMDRFRPNLVVTGAGPFAEDGWARVRAGDVELRVVKPCERCVITTTDQQTGARGVEPLRTLATYRRASGGALFGQNAIPAGGGRVRRGDPVEVLESD